MTMIPLKTEGWMVNFCMRRVEPVVAEESGFNTGTYGRYRGPKRTYMLHAHQVHSSELEALVELQRRMTARYGSLVAQVSKYRTELASVDGAINRALK
jgi:hypothetical protein